MLYDVQMVKGGNLVIKEWQSEADDFVEEIVEPGEIPLYLYANICLAHNINLRDVFAFMSQNIPIYSVVTCCPFLDEMIEEAFSSYIENKDIMFLELSRKMNVYKNELSWHFDLQGIGEDIEIEFLPINELIGSPLLLNENIEVIDDEENVLLKTKMPFTLTDVLTGIVEDLAFIGPPSMKTVIKDNKEEGQIISFDDLQKKIEERIDKNKVPCIVCGKDARSAQFDKPKNICGKCFDKIKEN